MTNAFRRLFVCSFVLLGIAAPSPLLAAVAGYSWFIQNDPGVLVQYDFVGNSDAERREDKSPGTNHLVEKQVGSPTDPIAYGVAGFDSTSTAVLPSYTNVHNAMGFFTSQMIDMPNPVSFEAILRPGGTARGYMAATYSPTSPSYRTYFVAQTDPDRLSAIAGSSWDNHAHIVDPFTLDNWYYVAVTMSYDPDDGPIGKTTMNTWHADLTAGTPLTPSGQNVKVDGSYLTNHYLGLGLLNNNGTAQEAWKGTIDEVTLYSGLKDGAFFQANLDRIRDPMFDGVGERNYYRMETDGGAAVSPGQDASVVDDASLLMYHGAALPAAAPPTYSSDVPGSLIVRDGVETPNLASLSFSGAGDYVELGNQPFLKSLPEDDFTIEFFLKTPSRDSRAVVVGTYDGSTSYIMNLEIGGATHGANQGSLRPFFRSSGSFDDFWGATDISDNEWHHVALVRSGAGTGDDLVQLYVDYELDGQTALNTGQYTIRPDFFRLGRDSRGSGFYYEGLLDEFRISRAALDVSEFLRAGRTWTGGGADNLWTTAANWTGATAPAAGNALFFGGTTRLTPENDFAADTSFGGITFNSDAGAFVLSGNRITLDGNLTNNSTNAQTVQLDMILDSTRTVAGSVILEGVLSGDGGLTKTGSGILTLAGSTANSYNGLTTVSGGRLILGKTANRDAVPGDLDISSGTVTFNADQQIASDAVVTMSGASSAFNGTAFNAGYRNTNETIGSLIVTGGAFNTGTGGTGWNVTGAASFTGEEGNTIFLGHSSSTSRFGSLSLTDMNATAGSTPNTPYSFTLYGNNASKQSSIFVGAAGLTLDDSVINLRRGSGSAKGSRLVLDGNVLTTGTSASAISEDTAGGTAGDIAVELSSTTGNHTRTFNIGGGGADLTISVPVTDGAATSAGITKIGDGTLTLSGSMANTYTGLTTVSAGRLALSKSAGVNAVAGDLDISGGVVTFNADEQIANTATVNMSGATSVFNGTGFDAGFRNTTETIRSLVVTGGIFQMGIGASWTVTDAVSFTGGAGSNTIFIGNSGNTSSFGSLSLTDMNATSSGNTPSSFTLYGSHGTWQSSITVGSGGLNLEGSVVNLRLGGTGAKGSRLVLDGNVTTTGTSASSIVLEGGTEGNVAVELSSTGGAVTRTFNIGGDGANLTISVPITNGESSGAGIMKTGPGTLTLNGTTTYTGGTTITEGVVQLGANDVLADTGAVTVSGGTLNIGSRTDTVGAFTLISGSVTGTGILTATSYDVRSGTISAGLGGSGDLTKTTGGTVTLSGSTANTYNGLTTVSSGRLTLGKTANRNAVPGDLAISGGAVTFSANEQIADDATVTMSGASSAFNGTGLNGNVFHGQETIGSLIMTGGIFQTGTGTGWTVTGAASFTGGAGNTVFIGNSGSTSHFGSLSLTNMPATAGGTGNRANSFTLYGNSSKQSSITVGSGGLALDGSVLNLRRGVAGGRLVLDGDVSTTGMSPSAISEDTAGGSNGNIAVELSSTTGTHTREFNISGGGADLTVGVPVTDGAAASAGITKTGLGTLTLGAANTYTGLTTVLGGTLEVTGSLAKNTSADVLVASAGTAFDGTEPAIVRSVGDGAPFADLGSQIIGDRLFDTRADLLAGTNQDPSGDPLPVGMAWRMFADGESQSTAPYLHAVSDVVQLTGITDTSPFVLQMTYDASLVTPATEGGLHLAWLDGAQWVNAVAGNSDTGDDAVARYLGSWDAFTNDFGDDLNALLGSWGVDTGSAAVWAVLNHNSEFGVLVPEPGTWLMLLAAAAAGLLLRRSGKR